MTEPETITYNFRSYKPFFNALTACVFGAVCLLVLSDKTAFTAGWIALGVCAAFAVFEFWEFSRNKCTLTIASDSIRETVGGQTVLDIAWRDFGIAETFDEKATVRIRLLKADGTIAAPEEAGWVKNDLFVAAEREPHETNKYLMGKYGKDQKALAQQINQFAARIRA